MYGRAFDNMILAFMLGCAIAGAAVALVCVYVLPWLWSLIKPCLHAITA